MLFAFSGRATRNLSAFLVVTHFIPFCRRRCPIMFIILLQSPHRRDATLAFPDGALVRIRTVLL
jgi:hypothetical protein